MKQEILNTTYINQSKVLINSTIPQSLSQPIQSDSHYNTIVLSASISIFQPLNLCLKNKADLLKVWIKGKLISISLQCVLGQYCFEEMNYWMLLRASSNRLSQKVQISLDKLHYQLHTTVVLFTIRVTQDGKNISQLRKNKQIFVEFGNKNPSNVITCQISSFMLEFISNQGPLSPLVSPCNNKISFRDNYYQLPLTLFKDIHDIYSAFQIDSSAYIQESLYNIIKSLPKYRSPQSDKQNKFYLCHDMKGGYYQDIALDNNVDARKIGQYLRYRSLHIEQLDIFNYFSHYNITIPPKHWRVLCKKYQTKCLGTFIIEKPVDQNFLCSQQLALFLVAIAKKCQFDGYLINIQTNIKAITAFKKWLDFLTKSIHNYIPNSSIIWYDSISNSDGVIRYQNCLNQVNYQFYHITDGLFTNYWWNQDLLKQTLTYKKQNPKKVYIGNDCFGRNTYGGGQFDIYKGTMKVMQYKNELSFSLFATGYTYEANAAELNKTLYHNQQMQMYKGVKSQYIPVKKWKYSKGKGKDWKQQAQWAVTSFQLCQRAATFKFNTIDKNTIVKVFVSCQVAATPPLIDSPYKLIFQLLDSNDNIVYQSSSYNFNDYRKATQKVQYLNEEVVVDSDKVGEKEYSVKIIEMGKSRQYWAGHYGPRFRNQYITVLVYEKQKHWTSKISIKQLTIGENYHSYCNNGFGDNFHYLGNKLQSSYSYLMDFDQPHTHIINLPFDTAFNYNEAFIGGSSLTVSKESIKLFRAVIPHNLNLNAEYLLQLTFKKTEKIDVVFKYLTKIAQQRIFSAVLFHEQKINGWKTCTYKLTTVQKQVKVDIRTIIDLNSQQYPYILGQIKFIKKQPKQNPKIKVIVQLSKEQLITTNYYLNLQISCNILKKLIVSLQNYAGFAYLQNQKASIRNIAINKSQEINIQIIDPDNYLQHKVLKQISIKGQQLVDLIFKGKLQFD